MTVKTTIVRKGLRIAQRIPMMVCQNQKKLPVAPEIGPVVFLRAACLNNNFAHEFAELFLVISAYRACKHKHTLRVAVPIGFATRPLHNSLIRHTGENRNPEST
jgi:hypothetical protein